MIKISTDNFSTEVFYIRDSPYVSDGWFYYDLNGLLTGPADSKDIAIARILIDLVGGADKANGILMDLWFNDSEESDYWNHRYKFSVLITEVISLSQYKKNFIKAMYND